MAAENRKLGSAVLIGALKALLVAGGFYVLCVLVVGWAEIVSRGPAVQPDEDGVIVLAAPEAVISGTGSARLESFSGKQNIGYWDHKSQSLKWYVDVDDAASYEVVLDYSLMSGMRTEFKVVGEASELSAVVDGRGGWADWRAEGLGRLSLESGSQMIELQPTKLHQKSGVMNFVSLALRPVGSDN